MGVLTLSMGGLEYRVLSLDLSLSSLGDHHLPLRFLMIGFILNFLQDSALTSPIDWTRIVYQWLLWSLCSVSV